MARIYARGGELVRYPSPEGIDTAGPLQPSQFDEYLELDATTNVAVLTAIAQDHNGHRLQGGVITRNGQPVSINPPSLATMERQQVAALARVLRDFNALDPATLTTAQKLAEIWKAIAANNRLSLVLARLALDEAREV
jgi:hypothetical protein